MVVIPRHKRITHCYTVSLPICTRTMLLRRRDLRITSRTPGDTAENLTRGQNEIITSAERTQPIQTF